MNEYWSFDAYLRPLQNSVGGPINNTVTFEPSAGPPISRRATTARMEMWTLSFSFPDAPTVAAFEAWFTDDLRDGVLPFVWRHPRSQVAGKWRFAPAEYKEASAGGTTVHVSFQLTSEPGAYPLGAYMFPLSARPPDWVADYGTGQFWVAGERVAATALAALSGTYQVLRQDTSGTRSVASAVYATDIPQTAPTLTSWLAGYLL
jgi:hypothetical protein